VKATDFIDIAAVLDNQYLQKWKADGNKVVGYTCSYLPDEILHAVNILPYRIRGINTTSTMIGDTYFGPFICSFPKCVLQLAGEGQYDFLDGAIITPGCDSIRRLDECWRKTGEDYPNAAPDFFHYFGVPHKIVDYSLDWFIDEIRDLISAIEKHFKVKLEADRLRESIKLYNNSRKLTAKLDQLRIQDNTVLSGTNALAAILAGTALPRETYNMLLEEFLSDVEHSEIDSKGKKRIMLIGSMDDSVELVQTIEGERAIIVADNLCFGPRQNFDFVEETEDPIAALAERYLRQSDCPRMFGLYKERLETIMNRVNDAKIDGVILQNIRFCDLHGSENGLLERDLEAVGIPCLKLEREYGPMLETGRIRMRLDAFMERLSR